MSELDKNQQRIDWYLQNNNFKQAINYVTSLKQQGMSPENVSFLQVYISKKMGQSQTKNQGDLSKKKHLKTETLYDQITPRKLNTHTPRGSAIQNQLLQSSQPYLQDSSKFLGSSIAKINNNNSQRSSQSFHQATFTKLNEQYHEEQKLIVKKEDKLSSRRTSNKQAISVIQLPSLNNIENEQYNQLKSVVKESLKDLNGKINLKYFKSNALLQQANYYNSRKEYDKAIEFYDQAMEVDTNNVNILMGKGDCLRKQGQFEAALECYEYAMNLNPLHKFQFRILFNKGNVLKCLGRSKEAIECYSKASLLDPSNPNTYFNKALTLYSLGELDEVIDNYSRVIRNNPKDQHAFLNKGKLKIVQFISQMDVLSKQQKVFYSLHWKVQKISQLFLLTQVNLL